MLAYDRLKYSLYLFLIIFFSVVLFTKLPDEFAVLWLLLFVCSLVNMIIQFGIWNKGLDKDSKKMVNTIQKERLKFFAIWFSSIAAVVVLLGVLYGMSRREMFELKPYVFIILIFIGLIAHYFWYGKIIKKIKK